MEGKPFTETYDTYLENESNHLKVFNMPANKSYSKTFLCVFVIVTLIILVTVGPVFWNNHSNLTESHKVEHKIGKVELKEQKRVWNHNAGNILHINVTRSIVDHKLFKTSHKTEETAPNQTFSEKENVLKYLYHVTGKHAISGLFVTSAVDSSSEGIETIQRIAGVSPGIINKCMPKYEENKAAWNSFVNEVIFNWHDHHLMCITWYLHDHPLRSMDIFTNRSNTNEVEERWNDLVNDGGHLNKVWKRQLDLLAPYLQQLQTAGVVAMLDILPWTNKKSQIWSGRPGPFGTAKLYTITHDYLTKHHNLTSLIWMWSLDSDYMTGIRQFWPGSDYVDVVSVYMFHNRELPVGTYQRLVEVVGDKPMSMEILYSVPTPQLLALQPRWTWFTARASALKLNTYNNDENIKTTFTSLYVINKDDIDYFNETN